MKTIIFVILNCLLVQQKTLAETAKLQHLPDGASTILSPAGEDLGIRFQLKSIKIDGVPISLKTVPEINAEKYWSILRWNDYVTEHWLYNNDSWNMELSIDLNGLTDVNQEISIDYLIDTTTEEHLSVNGSSLHPINDEWSLNFSRPFKLAEQSCQRIKHATNKNQKVRQFKWIVDTNVDQLNLMMTADVSARKPQKAKFKLNDFYTNGNHLFVTDSKDRVMSFELKNRRFEAQGFLPDPSLQIGEYRLAEQFWLNHDWLVMAGNDQFFFYDLEQQQTTLLPKLRIQSMREVLGLEKGYLTLGEHIVADGKSIYIAAETHNQTVIGEFQLKNNKWKIKDTKEINELIGPGLEDFAKNGSTWYFLTYGPERTLNLKKVKQQNNKWRLIDTGALEPGYLYNQGGIKLSKSHLVIPLYNEQRSEVWVFDLNNSLETDPQILTDDSNELVWQDMHSGFGQQVVMNNDFIYVLSPYVIKKSPETQKLMPESSCLTDTLGQVDVWEKADESWNKVAKINSQQSQYNILRIIHDEYRVYVVIEDSVNQSYQLIPVNQGRLDRNHSLDIELNYD